MTGTTLGWMQGRASIEGVEITIFHDINNRENADVKFLSSMGI
jgi:hypothetical protein